MTSSVHIKTNASAGIAHAIEFDADTGAVSLFTYHGIPEYNQQDGIALNHWQQHLRELIDDLGLVGAFAEWIKHEVGEGPETVITDGPPLEWYPTEACAANVTESALVVDEGNP